MYTYQYGGENGVVQQLVAAKDLVVIRTQKEPLADLPLSRSAQMLFSNMLPVTSFPEANVTVYKVLDPEHDKPKTQRNLIRQIFSTETGVRFAGRVLKDPSSGTIKVYTENFFVKFKDDLAPKTCLEHIEKVKLEVKEELGFAKNAYFLGAPEGTGRKIFAIAEKLLKEKEVEFCHPEIVQERRSKAIYPMQWHLKTTRINGQRIDQNVEVEKAWLSAKGEGITIAVIDDGVDVDHEEFQEPGKVVHPRDTIINRNDAIPKFSIESHGTACAGVACAAGKFKASGVAPLAKLMPIRSGGLGSMSEAKAFRWAADHGADIISCSWGPRDGAWFNPEDPLHTTPFFLPDSSRLAIDYAVENGRQGRGCVITWAAGNGNENVRYDGYASYDRVIAVAACNDRGKRSVYSDYGKAVWCAFPSSDIYYPQFGHQRPITAGIWTTDRSSEQGYNPGGREAEELVGDKAGNYTTTFGGTSSACPGVAGVVALVLEINPALTWMDVKQILRNSCDKIDPQSGRYDADGHSLFYGYGRINASKAVENAKKTLGPVDDFDVQGVAHFSKSSSVALQEGVLSFDDHENNRFIGLRLLTNPVHPQLSISYRLFVSKFGPTAWLSNGALAETSDKRRKIVGFQVKLTGPLADSYTVEYAAKLKGRKTLDKAKDGAICGTKKKTGRAIREIQIEIKNK
ncbi:MAG: S8 family serine peptidase [Bacteroidota bacterium]